MAVNCGSIPHFKKTWVEKHLKFQAEQSNFQHDKNKFTSGLHLMTSFPQHFIYS